MRLLFILLTCFSSTALAEVPQGPPNVPEFSPAFKNQTRAPELRRAPRFRVETISAFNYPWGVEVLPDGRYLVTEKPGRLKLVAPGKVPVNVRGVPKVLNQRQGGLLDVALAEDFAASKRIFLTYAKPIGRGGSATAAATAVLAEEPARLVDLRDIFIQTPPSPNALHYGSRIVLKGPHAYITTGEHSTREERVLAQDLKTTYGKVVRITLDGGIPADNPTPCYAPWACSCETPARCQGPAQRAQAPPTSASIGGRLSESTDGLLVMARLRFQQE